MESKRKYLLGVLMAGTVLFLFNLGRRDLWEPDETRYAVVAREMRENGDWILPRLNGQIYAEKPPLFFWLGNVSTTLLGDNEFANRLPPALAGLIAVLVTFLFGERLFNARAGFLSGLVLETNFFFPRISRWIMLDSLITLLFLLSLFCYYLGFEKEDKRRRYYLLAGLFMGLGVLTKGPLAYLAIPIFFIFASAQHNLKRFWTKDLLLGCFLSLFIVLVWWIPAGLIGGKNYIHWLLFKQAVGTYIEGGRGFHPQPFYFYLIRFPLEFLPWTAFLPVAFFFGFRHEREKRKEFLLLSIWFFFIFLFFTFSRGKKDNYLLPLYPAASMLVGRWLCSTFETGKRHIRVWIPLGAVTLFFLSVPAFILLRPSGWFPGTVGAYLPFGMWPLIFTVLGGLLSLLLIRMKRWNPWSISPLMVALMISQTFLSIAIPDQLNETQSMKSFSRRILRKMKSGDELKIWKFQSTGLLYYTGRPVEQVKTADRFLEVFRSPERVFMVVEEEDFGRLKERDVVPVRIVERSRAGRHALVLISNQLPHPR
jgi:4-amino-4-deoxy-L-arabinose transferase-like glycosyltransferase